MVALVENPQTSLRAGVASPVNRYVGEVVYIYAFDVAYEMMRLPVRELLGQPVAQFSVDASKRSPKQLFFYRPQMVRLPPLERIGPRGPLRLDRVVKLLPVGAVSITVRVPFEVTRIEDLVAYHDLQFSNGALHHEVRQLAEEVSRELAPYLVRPIVQFAEEEAYDRILDDALERSYRDLGEKPLRRKGDVLRELREIRVDLARLSDELSNITKFFGDWHLARIYQNISARFHLGDWHRTIDEKLETLDNLYQLLQHDQTNRWMLMLEATIVLLFVIDLVLLFVGLEG